jgi:hypothetical protein
VITPLDKYIIPTIPPFPVFKDNFRQQREQKSIIREKEKILIHKRAKTVYIILVLVKIVFV